jgi:Leucine-rich repeat (LRR) protein
MNNMPTVLVRGISLFVINSLQDWSLLRLVNRHFNAALGHPIMLSYCAVQIESPLLLNLGPLCKGIRNLHLTTLEGSNIDCQALVSLRSLTLSGCDTLCAMSSLLLPLSLQHLDLSFCTNLKCLQGLNQLQNLRSLDLAFVHGFGRLPPLSPSLRELGLSFSNIRDLAAVAALPNLSRLDLSGCSELSDTMLNNLQALLRLTHLNLTGCVRLRNLSPLGGLPTLKNLNLSNCHIQDLEPLSTLGSLSRLELANCDKLANLHGIPNVRALNLNFCTTDGLGSLGESLRELHLAGSDVFDLRAVIKLPKLERLYVWTCERLDDSCVSSLHLLKNLKLFDVYQCEKITTAGMRALCAHNPDLHIAFRCS